jgi:peptidoglycan/xylan/chitin deacetylase (PgdA/CDA1 family)
MRQFRPFVLARLLYPGALFRMKTNEKEICLTFDDGPDPASTLRIIEMLGDHKIRVVFFCTGPGASEHPELMRLIISHGHIIGNHGFSHIRGWSASTANYLEDVSRASPVTSPYLFRPPYGSLRPSQFRRLKKTFVVMFWDLMPYDFDAGFGSERSLRVMKKKTRPGSVIVLHDKASSSVLSFLEEYLVFAEKEGYKFVIPGAIMQERQKLPESGA